MLFITKNVDGDRKWVLTAYHEPGLKLTQQHHTQVECASRCGHVTSKPGRFGSPPLPESSRPLVSVWLPTESKRTMTLKGEAVEISEGGWERRAGKGRGGWVFGRIQAQLTLHLTSRNWTYFQLNCCIYSNSDGLLCDI